jgi:hypothetical protein
MTRRRHKMTDRHNQVASQSPTPRPWRQRLPDTADRAALWGAAHVVEAIFIFAMLVAVLAAIFGALPNADLSGLLPEKSCCRGGE